MKIHIFTVVSALHEIINSQKCYELSPFSELTYYEIAETIITTCKPKHKMWSKTK